MQIKDVESDLSKRTKEMKIPNQYDNRDWGAVDTVVTRKVSTKSTDGTNIIYGSKTIATKESVASFVEYLINEDASLTALPDQVISEIKSNIRKGATDLIQKWTNALELVDRAYLVANVEKPNPTQKGAWAQYIQLIQYGVKQLVATRGLDGEWRSTGLTIQESSTDLPSHRFFVEIPGERAQEVAADSLDEIVETISNKIRANREVINTKVRVESKTSTQAVLSVWVDNIKREQISIRQI